MLKIAAAIINLMQNPPDPTDNADVDCRIDSAEPTLRERVVIGGVGQVSCEG